MTSQFENPIGQSAQPAEDLEISRETLLRCAELLARGEIGWPSGLSQEQERTLTAEIRKFRRTNLMKFIAAQIAADIAAEIKGQVPEVPK
jgi:hypothetical protein